MWYFAQIFSQNVENSGYAIKLRIRLKKAVFQAYSSCFFSSKYLAEEFLYNSANLYAVISIEA